MNREDVIRMAEEAGATFDHMTWVERDLQPVFKRFAALVAAAEREALLAERVAAIRSLTDQCAALIRERDDFQKQLWRYEKNGVTCQTYRHTVEQTCAECNVQMCFAALAAAEKDKEIKRLQDLLYTQLGELTALRAEKQMRGHIKEQQEQPR